MTDFIPHFEFRKIPTQIEPNKARLDNRWGFSVGRAFRGFNPSPRLNAHSRPSGASA
jgi:hypothetical protein